MNGRRQPTVFLINILHRPSSCIKKKISACASFSTITLTTMYYWSYFAAEEIGAQRNSVSWRRSQLISRRTKKRSSLGFISHTNGHCCRGKALGLGKTHLILAFPTPTPTSPIFLTELADSIPKNRLKCVQCSAGTELENVRLDHSAPNSFICLNIHSLKNLPLEAI